MGSDIVMLSTTTTRRRSPDPEFPPIPRSMNGRPEARAVVYTPTSVCVWKQRDAFGGASARRLPRQAGTHHHAISNPTKPNHCPYFSNHPTKGRAGPVSQPSLSRRILVSWGGCRATRHLFRGFKTSRLAVFYESITTIRTETLPLAYT